MPNRQATEAELERALAEVESAQLAVRALQSRMHGHGQTHWMGWSGAFETRTHHYDCPDPVFEEAHRLWRLASRALERSGHILVMAMVGAEPAPLPPELEGR